MPPRLPDKAGSRVVGPPRSSSEAGEATLGLLPKPESCRGCPLWGNGQGFVGDEIRHQAPVMVIAQNPGADEEAGRRYLGSERYESCNPAPLIGRTGRMMDKDFLPLAGLSRDEVSLGNVLRCRLQGKNELPDVSSKVMQQARLHCMQAHFKRPEGVKVFVAMGEHAMAGLTGLTRDFNGWRGYMAPLCLPGDSLVPMSDVWHPMSDTRPPVFITHHLAYLFREPTASLPAKRDWNKLALILNGKWPVRFDHTTVENQPPDPWPSYAAFDTEFAEDNHEHLVRFSLATKDRRVWVVEASNIHGKMSVLPKTSVVMHNAPADLPHLRGLIDTHDLNIEDTMYAHACLWTGKVETDDQRGQTGGAMSHTLNFLGSMYAYINRWKHLVKVSPRLYAGGDALGTMDVWTTGLNGGLLGELDRDPETKWVYENLQKPLVGIVLKHHQRGIAVDSPAVKRALVGLEARQAGYTLQAQASCGWPINLRSPKQVAYWLYDVEGLKVKRTRRA